MGLVEDDDVFAPFGGKAAESIEVLERRRGARGRLPRLLGGGRHLDGGRRLPARCRCGLSHGGKLLAECAALPIKHRARGRLQQNAIRLLHIGGIQEIYAAAPGFPPGFPGRSAGRCLECLDGGVQSGMQLRGIGRRALVHDDEIHNQPFEPPKCVRTQQQADDIKVLRIVDARQHDGQVAGYSEGPQGGGPQQVLGEKLAGRSQPGIEIQHRIGGALKQFSLLDRDAEIAQLRFGRGAGAGFGEIEGRQVTEFVGQCERRRAARADPEPKIDACGFSGRDPHPPAQGQHRIQHRSDAAGQRPRIDDRDRIAQAVTPAEKTRSIGFELQRTPGGSLDGAHVDEPQRRIRRLAGAAGGEQCAAVGGEFGAHEKLGEGWMSRIGRGRRQHHFRIAGQFDFPGPLALIGQ